jgi:hypothetical protein
MMMLMLQAAIEKLPSETVRRCSVLSNVIRDDQEIKTTWGKMSFVYFHTVVILTVFSELYMVSSPDTLASRRERALWICGFYFFASSTGAKLWNIVVVLTLSFASDVIATGNWEQLLLTPRNSMLLVIQLCLMVDVLTNVDHECKAEHCKQYLLFMFTSICLPILWSTRATLPQIAIPVIICLLCFSFFAKASLHATKNLSELGEMAVYILHVFGLVCASKGPGASGRCHILGMLRLPLFLDQ